MLIEVVCKVKPRSDCLEAASIVHETTYTCRTRRLRNGPPSTSAVTSFRKTSIGTVSEKCACFCMHELHPRARLIAHRKSTQASNSRELHGRRARTRARDRYSSNIREWFRAGFPTSLSRRSTSVAVGEGIAKCTYGWENPLCALGVVFPNIFRW